jgi:ABC-type transporter Mla MlaB component
MLKISTHEDDQMVRLEIEGALAGCWVKEFELSWRAAQAILDRRSLQVDLTGTTRVDTAGYYLLRLMHKEGVQFLASGPSMQALISEITGDATGVREYQEKQS